MITVAELIEGMRREEVKQIILSVTGESFFTKSGQVFDFTSVEDLEKNFVQRPAATTEARIPLRETPNGS